MATRQKLHLAAQNLEYSRFVKDQVLTEVQLNEVIDFFEDQHRLTRTCLIGTGIVCGLEVRQSNKAVTLGPGAAITTDGDLVKTERLEYTHFVEYTMPDDGIYKPFLFKEGSQEKAVKLYRLLTEEETGDITSGQVRRIDQLDGTISNWVALLYLEYYLKKPEKCTPTHCDNMGQRQVARPMLLAISKNDLDKVIHRDAEPGRSDERYLKYHEAFEKYFNFPQLRPKRVILNKTITKSAHMLAGAYFNAAKNGSTLLATAIEELYSAFRLIIDKEGHIDINRLKQRLMHNLTQSGNALHAQYTYDHYKDVVVAYDELRDTLYNAGMECGLSIYAFPKHIMLGEPNIRYGPLPPRYRHRFYPSPLISHRPDAISRAISMFKRLELMILHFAPGEVSGIRITPSGDYDKPLEKRAIPFYYVKPKELTKQWNYTRSLQSREKDNLSYHANTYDVPVPDATLNPLDYDIDGFNFFRVEGHIGKNFRTVMRELDKLKNEKGIPIDLVAVRQGDVKLSDIDLEDYDCHFEDLNAVLQAFQAEISCLLGEGSRFFSGFTPNPDKPHIILDRYIPPIDAPTWNIPENIVNAAGLNINYQDLQFQYSGGQQEMITGGVQHMKRSTRVPQSGFEVAADIGAAIGKTGTRGFLADFCKDIERPVFPIDRIVPEAIDRDSLTFGKSIHEALKEPVSSVDELAGRVRTMPHVAKELQKLDEDQKFVFFEYPVQIVGHLLLIQHQIPESIRTVTPEMIARFRKFSLRFCARLKVMRARLEKHFRTGKYESKGFESAYLDMISRMERICCANEKLEVIMREIEKRKATILAHLSFEKYAERHPGLEHKAGSHRGGTFVIVYAGANATSKGQSTAGDTRMTSDLPFDPPAPTKAAGGQIKYRDIDSFANYVASHDDNINREEELARFLEINRIQAASTYGRFVITELNKKITDIRRIICRDIAQPAQDVVIADFCLPYLCCSDCPPVAFLIQKDKEPGTDPEPVSLDIQKTRFCSDDQQTYPFGVTPENGAVSAKDADLSGSVIPSGNGEYLFKPSAVPVSHRGKPIGFTVNGKEADLTVIVIQQPVAKILKATIGKGSHLTHVSYVITLQAETNPDIPEDKINYKWHIGDQYTFEGMEVQEQINTQSYEDKIPVKLVVTNEICSAGDETTILIEQEEEPQTNCREVVEKFVTDSQRSLANRRLVTLIRAMNDPGIVNIHGNVVNLFNNAADLLNRPRPGTIMTLLEQIDKQLLRIYEFSASSTHPQAISTLEVFIRSLWMLMLNMVRCFERIPDNKSALITAHISKFKEMQDNLLRKYPGLNQNKQFENFITEYDNTFVSEDPGLKKALKVLLKSVQHFK